MYACVLIPRSLSLVLTLHPNPGNMLEMAATVWANVHLHQGHVFFPDEGELRLDQLEVYSVLADNDIRRQFGCYDVIHEVDGQEVRHCNWIRFVKVSNNPLEVNVIGSKVRGCAFYQVIKYLKPNDELVVLLNTDTITSSPNTLTLPKTSLNDVRLESETRRNILPVEDNKSHQKDEDENISDIDEEDKAEPTTHADENEDDEDKGGDESDEEDNDRVENNTEPERNTPIKEEEVHDDTESEPDAGFFSYSKGDNSGHLDNSDDIQREEETAKEGEKLHHSLESDQSSPREDRVTSSEMPEITPCPVSPRRVLAPDSILPPPPDGAPVRRARERTWWPCSVCPKKFDRPSLLKRHVRTHTGEKPHACDVCGKAFSTSSSLNTHRRIHSGEKPHQCPICGKRFTASSNLYYHRMTHNKEKPHKCSLCSKSFPTPGDLRSHMYVHSGSWPFRCHVCNRGFSKQTNLKNHLLLHSGDKPHECPKCGKRFALQCNLKTHMKTHEVDNATSCNDCGVLFSEKDKKMADGTCAKCFDLCPVFPPIAKNTKPQQQKHLHHHHHHHHHQQQPQQQQDATAKKSKRFQPSDFSISKLTDRSLTPSAKNGNSPDMYPGMQQVSPVPMSLTSPFSQIYGHRPWLMAATVATSSPPSSYVSASQFTSPMMACVMKDMASLPPYALFGGKTSTPVSSFISPDVLARGGGFLPASAHGPSSFPLTPATPVGGGGWQQQPVVQGL